MEKSVSTAPELHPYATKRIGTINRLGVWTLYVKEVRRFFKVFGQTVMAPVVTTGLFMMIFTIALSGGGRYSGEIPFPMFLAPGLAIMSVLQNSFANTISSMMSSKMQGNIIDLLLAPLGPGEITLAFVMAGVTRGILVGFFVISAMFVFTEMNFPHIWAILYFGISAAMLLALIGLMAGIWAEKWDQSATISNFIIMPLAFLSGTFYSIDRLPGIWHSISQANPFFYLIDGFRYGFIDRAEGDLVTGVIYIGILNIICWIVCYKLLKSGYKLRS